MLLQRSIVVVLTLLFHEYVAGATPTTADEGVDYEALDAKKFTANDPQLNQMYVLHGMVESSQDTTDASDDEGTEVDAAPSQIIETHVLPDNEQTEPVDESHVQTKRPRRRRRRRRRKRPKPVPPPADELESYYALPEDEIKRKPSKYHGDAPEELSSPPVDASDAPPPPPPPPRRRNVKRRRRPIKRPPIDVDYPAVNDGANTETNQTDAQVDQPMDDANEALVSAPSPSDEPPQEIHRTTPTKSKDTTGYRTTTQAADDVKARPKDTDQVGKTFTSIDARRYENEAASELAGSTLRRRKRPSFKIESTADTVVETTTRPESPTSSTTPDTLKSHPSPYVTAKNEAKIDDDNQQKYNKHFDRSKYYNETKKESFKLRPLPPISAILRNARLRTKNETHVKVAKAAEIPARIKETVSNEIQTHVVFNDEQHKETPPPRNNAKVEDSRHEEATTESSNRNRDVYETPVIAYTEHKQKSTTTSPVRPITESTTTTTTTTTTTENTAYIYIPCNHTTNDGAVASGSRNDTATISSTTYDNGDTVANVSTVSTFETAAIHELEKLLRSEIDTFDSRNTSERPAQSQDASALESQLDYLFQRKSAIREPKEIPEFSSKLKHDSKENRASKTSKPSTTRILNDDIFLTYTSTAASPPAGFYNELDPREYELSLHLRNASTHYRKIMPESVLHKGKNQAERKKLPLAVKSAIIISGAILALAVLGFFALLLSCKIRQAKSRMKCHRELYREQFQNSEFRQSSRSTSPVVSKSNYNGRTFSNNIQSNVASNRNYYLWQTLRKTFQYD